MAASVKVPTYKALQWPMLKAIEALGGSGTSHEIDAKVAEIAGLSEEQLAVLHGEGPVTEVNYRLAWARTYLKAAAERPSSCVNRLQGMAPPPVPHLLSLRRPAPPTPRW